MTYKRFISALCGAYLVSSEYALADPSYADLVRSILPTVVSISVKGTGPGPADSSESKSVGYARHIIDVVGAGAIVDATGLIVTNKHVIENAYKITVKLQDGKVFPARLLGQGLGFDLAVLKVESGYPLPVVEVGDSDRVQVGDHVLAIGNPLGLQGSVTSGIVSALHRNLVGTPFDEYIQTDAAINHGSSGGPLFNTRGEIIGVVTQIFSDAPSGGSIGLGFAIPSNDVHFMMKQIRRHQRPHLGWLGLSLQTVTPAMADELKLEGVHGAIISEIAPKSPAQEARLQVGEVVLDFDKQDVTDYRMINRVAAEGIGKEMRLRIWHLGGGERIVALKIREWPQEIWQSETSTTIQPPTFTRISDLGLQIEDITDDVRMRFHIDKTTSGAVITQVAEDTVASIVGLRAGDVVSRVVLDDIADKTDFEKRIRALSDDGHRHALMLVRGGAGNSRWVALPLRF